MNFFNSKTNVIFSSIALLLVSAIIFLCGIISEKNDDIKSLETQISSNTVTIYEANKKIEEVSSELKKLNEETSKVRSEYNSITAENKTVKLENENIKKENEKLKTENAHIKKSNKTLETAHQIKAQKAEESMAYNGYKICYLTFDDGPSDNTLEILKILKKHNVLATFFVMNTNKIGYLKNIHEAGHTIGLHTYTHDYESIYKNTTTYFDDLLKISNKVYSITGVKSKIIRFPGGSSNKVSEKYSGKKLMPTIITQVAQKGYFYFDWNVDSTDASGNDVSYTKIRDSVLSAAKGRKSICVLMHDSAIKKSTVTALPEIIKGLKEQGYIFKPLLESSYGYHHGLSWHNKHTVIKYLWIFLAR